MRAILAGLLLFLVMPACVEDAVDACPDPLPALSSSVMAAPNPAVVCPVGVRFEGQKYWVICEEIPSARVGALLATEGEGGFTEARRLVGFSPEEVIVLRSQSTCLGKKPKLRSIGIGDNLTNPMEDRLLRRIRKLGGKAIHRRG